MKYWLVLLLICYGSPKSQPLDGFWRAIVSKKTFPDSIYRIEEYSISGNKFDLRADFKRFQYGSDLVEWEIDNKEGEFQISNSNLIEDGPPPIHYDWGFDKIWAEAWPYHSEYSFTLVADTLIVTRQQSSSDMMFHRISITPEWTIKKLLAPVGTKSVVRNHTIRRVVKCDVSGKKAKLSGPWLECISN